VSERAIAAMASPVIESKRTRIPPKAAVAWVLICVVAAIWLFPVVWILLTSLKTPDEIALPTPRLFFTPTVGNYARAWFDYKFGAGLANSFIAAGGATIITLIVGTLAAYGLTRFPIRGARHIALTILSLRMMPPISVVLPYYTIFQKLHLLDTLVGLVLIYLTTCLPFAIWLLYGFIREVPMAIDEAAMLDGASPLGTLWRFIVPAAAPGIAVTAIFSFLFTWNEFLFALILTDRKAVTYPVTISKFLEPYHVLWGELSAGGIMALVPVCLVLIFFQRYIVRGMTLGAIR
jgi:multiple sugar transport system permease protein